MPLRFEVRTLLRSPWYAITAIGTIMLTIALSATVFAVVDGVLFKPLPYADPKNLFMLSGVTPSSRDALLSSLDVENFRAADPRIITTSWVSNCCGLTHPDQPGLTIWTTGVDASFFRVLGRSPLVGGFTADDYATAPSAAAPQAAIVSHAFWRNFLGADPMALGRTVDFVGRRFVVRGVLGAEFVFPEDYARNVPDVLYPRRATPSPLARVSVLARLPDGMSSEQANAKLNAVLLSHAGASSPSPTEPGGEPVVRAEMKPLEYVLGFSARPFLNAAFAGAALLILLGAVNVAGLFAARARDRGRELSIRAALGAGPRHLMIVLVTEALIIAVVGGVIGIVLANPLLVATLQLLPNNLVLLKPPAIDWRVIGFAGVSAIVPVILFTAFPAALVMKSAPAERLAGGTTSTPRRRGWSRTLLIQAESAIGTLLVVAGSLVLASFITLRAEDIGFRTQGAGFVDVRMATRGSPAERTEREQQVLNRLRQMPGILDVAIMNAPFQEGLSSFSEFTPPRDDTSFEAQGVPVSGSFFQVAGLRLLSGRLPTPEEIDTQRPLVVVSEETARHYWPNGAAVGQVLESRGRGPFTVVGVVAQARLVRQDDSFGGQIYVPRSGQGYATTVYLLKASGDVEGIVRNIPMIMRREVPGVLVRRAESLDRAVAKSVGLHEFRAVLFSVAGGAGLLLLAVGIAGLVASSVARRVREIGIRSALGAPQPQLIRMIVGEHLRPVTAGVIVGLLVSFWATRLVGRFLYRIDPHDLLVWAIAATTLMVVSTVAAWIPARRASLVDPIVVLRVE